MRPLSAPTAALALLLSAIVPGVARANIVDVDQSGFGFTPRDITIQVGDTVVWHWSSFTHTVTEGDNLGITGTEAFNGPLDAANTTFQVTFDAAFLQSNPRANNFYRYNCQVHFLMDMKGTIQVGAVPGTPFCSEGLDLSVGACPCSNPPAGGGLGCDNFSACGCDPKSGTLEASGIAEVGPGDSLVLMVTGMNNTSTTVFFGGTVSVAPAISGGGLRCVGGQLKRLYSASSPAVANGAIDSSAATPAGVSVSDRSAALNSTITPGETRYYYNAYRDPMAAGPCGFPQATINTTNAISVVWQ